MLKQGSYVSAKSIVERIFRDVDYAEQLVDFSDCLEWMWEMIKLVELPMAHIDRVCKIEVTDHKGLLPSDFDKKIQVRDYDTLIPLTATTNLFYVSTNTSSNPQQAHINAEGGAVTLSSDEVSGEPIGYSYGYKINDGYIITELDECTVELAYKAFPIDNYGFPMILDDMRLIRALTNYVTWKIDYKAWRRGLVSDKIYQVSEQEYLFAVKVLDSSKNSPDLEMIEGMYRRRQLLVQNVNQFNESFETLGG